MSDKMYKVSIQGPGVAIEREVAEAVLPRLISLLLADAPGLEGLRDLRDEAAVTSATVGEFLSDLSITSNPERIAGIALFLKEALSRDRVTKDELPEWFQRAGQPAPKNLFRDLRNAVAQRLIAEDHIRPGAYLVTDSGVRKLRGDKGPANTPPARKQTRKRSARTSAVTGTGQQKASTTDGPTARVQELLDEGWFASQRTVSDLINELAARGAHYKAAGLTYQMQQFVKGRALRRKKAVPDGAKREVWHYSNW